MCFCSLRSFPLYQSFVSTRRAIGFADNAVLSLLRRSFDESFHFCAFVTTGEQYTGVGYSLNSVTVRYNRQTMAADKRSWVTEAIARIKRDIVIVEEKKRRGLTKALFPTIHQQLLTTQHKNQPCTIESSEEKTELEPASCTPNTHKRHTISVQR